MTRKLYYEEAYRAQFEAKVIACEVCKEGYTIELDKTVFYPEGGGQPSDRGMLADIKVNHVFIKEDKIYHVVEQPLEVGTYVEGKIDFKRRFGYMQQHTGEHIVSGIVHTLYGYENVGFHLSDTYMSVDFNGELTKEQLIEVEQRANEAVFRNIEVETALFPKKEIEGKAYRSKLDLQGDVRLVKIGTYDLCACCGTHLKHTGEVGTIKIISSERHRGGMRLILVCGWRAIKDYEAKIDCVHQLSALLSAKQENIVESVKKQQEEMGVLKQKTNHCMNNLFSLKAKEYVKQAKPSICIVEEGLTPEELRRFCMILIEETEAICLVLTPQQEGFKYALGSTTQDVRALCQEMNKTFKGRGGGKDICQGSIIAELTDVENFMSDSKFLLKL